MNRLALVAVTLALSAGVVAVVWRKELNPPPKPATVVPQAPAALVPPPPQPSPPPVSPPAVPVPVVAPAPAPTPIAAPPSARAARTPRKDAAPPPQRGQVFAAVLSHYVTPETLPLALDVVDDACQQQHAIVVDEAKRYEDALDHHRPYDRDGALAAARQVADLYHDMETSLAALPGSKFDKAAMKALLASTEYTDNCTKLKESDDAE